MEIEIQKKRYLQKKKECLNSSETAPISTEAPKSCSTRFLLSSNSSTSSSSHLQRKPKTLEPRISKNILKKSTTKVMPRSKENKQVLFPQKPKKNQRQSSKINTKPTIKNTQRSKLSSAQGNVSSKSKKIEELETKMKNSSESCSGEQQPYEILVESNYCSSLNYMFDNNTPGASVKNVGDNSTLKAANLSNSTNVRTPPVEVSESPEINKMLLSKSIATPVCYGAGHHLSGVTDKRKCRRRGSLKGGCEKAKLFDDELSDVNVITDLHDSIIPLLVEASVRLELSPCDEGREDLFSPLNSFGNVISDLVSDDRKDRCLRDLNVKTRDNVIGDASALSLGSLSSGNIIQTPNSNSSLERCVGRFVDFELDSIQDTLNRVSLSPKNGKSMDLGYAQVKENTDNGCSWVSDYTLDNLGLSSMKISWRDGLVSGGVDEKDEFDCCRCLSDEEIGNDVGIKSANNENDDGINSDLQPMILEYEPCICARGEGKLSTKTTNMCAESICTNGGDLVASGDSDWTYFHESNLLCLRPLE